jgi:hypothetical protein
MPLEDLSSSPCVVYIETISTFAIFLDIFFIKGGVGKYDLWPANVGNSWRTTDDIQDNWASMISNIDQVRLGYIFNNISPFLEQ